MSNSPGKSEGRPQRPAPWDEETGSSSAPLRNLPDSSRVQTSSVEEWMKMPHNTLGSDKGIQTEYQAKASRSMEYVDVIYNFNKIDASMKEIVPDEADTVDDDIKDNENVETGENVSTGHGTTVADDGKEDVINECAVVSESANKVEVSEPNKMEINPENISETPLDKEEISPSSVPGSHVMAPTGGEGPDTPYPVNEDKLLRESVREFLNKETSPIQIFNIEREKSEIKELQAKNPLHGDVGNRQSEEVNVESTPNISDAASETGVEHNVRKDAHELVPTVTVQDRLQSEKVYDEVLTDVKKLLTKVDTSERSVDTQQESSSTLIPRTSSQTEEITFESVIDVAMTSKTSEQSENMSDERLPKDVVGYDTKTQPEEKLARFLSSGCHADEEYEQAKKRKDECVTDDSKMSEASFEATKQKDECLHEETMDYDAIVESLEDKDNSFTSDKELAEAVAMIEVAMASEETTVLSEVIDDKSTIDKVNLGDTDAHPEEMEVESLIDDSIAENESNAEKLEKKSESISEFTLTSQGSTEPTEMREQQPTTDEDNKQLDKTKEESIDDVPETSKEAPACTKVFEEKSKSDDINNEDTDTLPLPVSKNIPSTQDEDIKDVSMTDVGQSPDKTTTQAEMVEGKSIFDITESQNEDMKDDRGSELISDRPDAGKNSDENGAQIKDTKEISETSEKTDTQTEVGVTTDEISSNPIETKDITKGDVGLTPDNASSQPEHTAIANEDRSAEAGNSQATVGQVEVAVQGVESTETSVSRLRRSRKRSSSQTAETSTPKRRSPRIPRYPDRLEYHRKGQC